MNSLADHVQALPSELYNEVYQLTFTAKREIRQIDKSWKPPRLLQVNHHSRELFASSYYGEKSIIEIHKYLAHRWIKTLTQTHASHLREVRLGRQNFEIIAGRRSRSSLQYLLGQIEQMKIWRCQLRLSSVQYDSVTFRWRLMTECKDARGGSYPSVWVSCEDLEALQDQGQEALTQFIEQHCCCKKHQAQVAR